MVELILHTFNFFATILIAFLGSPGLQLSPKLLSQALLESLLPLRQGTVQELLQVNSSEQRPIQTNL